MVYLNVTIEGKIESRDLWEDVHRFRVNVTDMIHYTWVYGELSMKDAMIVISICRKYGDIKSEVTSI